MGHACQKWLNSCHVHQRLRQLPLRLNKIYVLQYVLVAARLKELLVLRFEEIPGLEFLGKRDERGFHFRD